MGKGDAGVDSHWGLQVLNTGMDASHTDKRGSGDPGIRPEIRSSGWSGSGKLGMLPLAPKGLPRSRVCTGGGQCGPGAAAVLGRDRASFSDSTSECLGQNEARKEAGSEGPGSRSSGSGGTALFSEAEKHR